jgi:hypothetical protein
MDGVEKYLSVFHHILTLMAVEEYAFSNIFPTEAKSV